MNFQNIELIEAKNTKEDFELLKKIHELAMKEKVIDFFGEWDSNFQLNRLLGRFEETHSSLIFIKLDEKFIGTFNLIKDKEDETCLFLEQFYLIPEVQGIGLGKFLITEIFPKKEIKLTVLKKDILAQSFYIKNGFIEYGADEIFKYMKRS